MSKKEEVEFEFLQDLLSQFEQANARNEMIHFDEEEFEQIIAFYLQNNQAQLALDASEMALKLYPFSSEFCLTKADAHIELGELEEAEYYLIHNFKIDKSDVDYYIILSEVYLLRNNYEKAIEICLEGVDKCNDNLDELYLHLAEIYDHQGEYKDVIHWLDLSISINPKNEDAIYLYSMTMSILDKVPEKIHYFQSLLDKDPFNQEVWYYIAVSYREMGLYEKAIESLEYLAAIDEDIEVLGDMAQILYEANEYTKAIKCIKELERTVDLEWIDLQTLAKCYKELGNIYKAKYYFKEAMSLDEHNDDTYFELALLFYEEKKYEAALPLIHKALEKNKDYTHYLELKADILLGLNQTQEACSIYQSIVESNYLSSYYIGKFAYITALEYGLDKALLSLDQGIIDHNYPVLHYHKSILYFIFENEELGYYEFAKGLESDFDSHNIVFEKLPEMKENHRIIQMISLYEKE